MLIYDLVIQNEMMYVNQAGKDYFHIKITLKHFWEKNHLLTYNLILEQLLIHFEISRPSVQLHQTYYVLYF